MKKCIKKAALCLLMAMMMSLSRLMMLGLVIGGIWSRGKLWKRSLFIVVMGINLRALEGGVRLWLMKNWIVMEEEVVAFAA